MRRSTLIPAALGATLIGATLISAAPASATTASATTGTCEKAAWIGQVQGRPAGLGVHSRSGDYFWHDKNGFHLRVTQKRSKAQTYSGTITSNTPIVGFKWVKLEKQDKIELSADKLTINFTVVNHGLMDGFDFKTSCADTLTVSGLTINGQPLPRGKVYLGKYRKHPATIPFTVHRKA
ncbi:hypothetical protein Aph01nite_05920 [Acrocarpospora phusangensis]|uniref:Htaa domain-containing protein n=1 Tax=Acrocarpospora phusangensis TaxID=1070424 RepID=A0A919Q4R2_9ACTN|nr:hypothetical protein [Acrocarpospora phusangensis]GIH22282.1 hypothetical protein Aph01nite_05920 [Acrocarpospora phusangensis]